MFAGLTERLRSELEDIRSVVTFHAGLRDDVYTSGASESDEEAPAVWKDVRARAPRKTAWQIYDHCAGLMRLYAAYSAFVEDLIADYLGLLPNLYLAYSDLPAALLKQHRMGLGQILLKLGEAGPYRHLEESQVLLQASQAVAGQSPYALLREAFFVERHNYRLETLAKLLGYLGVDNGAKRIAGHPAIRTALEARWGESTTLQAELSNFVDLRNQAAHRHVEDVIAPDEFLSIATLIESVCVGLAEIVSLEVFQRHYAVGQAGSIGNIIHIYGAGEIPIVRMNAAEVSVGDQLGLLWRDRIVGIATVFSIQSNGTDMRSVSAQNGQELGFRLDRKCKVGMKLAKVVTSEPAYQQLPFADLINLEGTDSEDMGLVEELKDLRPGEEDDDDSVN